MKYRILLFTCLLLLTGTLVLAQSGETKKKEDGVIYYSYAEGLQKAKTDSVHVVVFFETVWCGWCKKMDKTTLIDARVVNLLKNHFVAVKVDGDKQRDLAREYGVTGYPSTWFLKSDGSKIAPIQGFWPADDFYWLLRYISESAYEKEQFSPWVKKQKEHKG